VHKKRSNLNDNAVITRRAFLGTTLATGAALIAGESNAVFGADSTTKTKMAINTTWKLDGDLAVNRLGFGAMRITGEGIWGWPPDRRPEHLKQAVEGSLKRLRLERIDLYQLHTVDSKVPIEDSLGALKEMQDSGKIRHVGLSNVEPDEIARAQRIVPIVSVQNRYNIEDRKSENVLVYCEKKNLGFLPWFPIGGGGGLKPENPLNVAAKAHAVSVVQVALAWLLERSPVMLPIPGTASLAHLEQNVAAAKLKLTPEEWQAVDAIAG